MSTLFESCMIRHQYTTKINYHIPDMCKIDPVTLESFYTKIRLSVPKTVIVSQVVNHLLKEQVECHRP